jgi:hypothetical protein
LDSELFGSRRRFVAADSYPLPKQNTLGLLVSRGWQIGDTFAALGIPALGAALFTSLISVNRPRGAAAADRVAAAAGEEL